jgi:hypothetical protein
MPHFQNPNRPSIKALYPSLLPAHKVSQPPLLISASSLRLMRLGTPWFSTVFRIMESYRF